jgi:hypothetical protein
VAGTIAEFCAGCGAVHCPFCQATESCEHRFAEVTAEGIYPELLTDKSAPRLSSELATSLSEAELREAFGDAFELLWQAYAPHYDESPPIGILADLILQYHCDGTHSVLCDFEPVGWRAGWIRYYFAEDPDAVKRQFADVLDELRAAFRRAEDLADRVCEDEDETATEADTQAPVKADARQRSSHGPGRHALRRSRKGMLPPSIILVDCNGSKHRVSLPRRGPIVLLDHTDRHLVEDTVRGPDLVDGCIGVLRRVRGRSSNNGWGWWMWLVHVAPKFGPAGWAIRERLREFDRRRKLRRLLRDVDLG